MSERKRFLFSENSRKRKFIIAIIFFAVLLLFSCVMLLSRVSDWNDDNIAIHRIINADNPVSAGWSPEFIMLDNGQLVCADCADELRSMLADCRDEGFDPELYSCYRSNGAQEEVLTHLTGRFIAEGDDQYTAAAKALALAGAPGCSEHQLGYAVDIIEAGSSEPDLTKSASEMLQWLGENSWRYGFILRYTQSGQEITGVEYLPWHFRYVGQSAAEQIYSLGITLEEYNEMFFS